MDLAHSAPGGAALPRHDLTLDDPAAGGWRRYAVRRLTLADFRNYSALRLELDARPVVLTGANGAGKTNLLEAVSYLVPGRGLRSAALDSVVRLGAESWAVAAAVEGAEGLVELGTGYRIGDSGRTARIDRAPARSIASLGRHLRISWLTPAMDGLFVGPPGDRRRFLDRLVLALDPAHATRVADYERTMRQRNRLLEDARPDARWLDGIEAEMAALAVAVAAARATAVQRLSALLEGRAGGAFPDPAIACCGRLEEEVTRRPAVEVEADHARALAASRRADAAAGRTLDGPHRSDLVVTHRGRGVPAALASTGEQKGLLIALTLAHARLVAQQSQRSAPLLLLDEIAAHLDDTRRSALFAELLDLGGQAWLTGTDRALFADIAGDAQTYEVSAATLTAW